MCNPKVSVIVPVYKVEMYLHRCVDSILSQSFDNIEIILVDDGSPDSSPILCDDFSENNPNIKVIHKENGGLSSARLAGYKLATGKYILFVDSDDYIEQSMIEKLVFAAEKNNADVVMCGYYTDKNGTLRDYSLTFDEQLMFDRKTILNKYVLPLVGTVRGEKSVPGFLCIRLHKRCLIQESFFKSERIYYKEDHIFDLLYSDVVEKIAIVNEPLYYYCYNSDSLSNCYRDNKWEMYCSLYTFYNEFLHDRNLDGEKRMKNSFAGAILSTVDNAVLSRSFDVYQRDLNTIVTTPFFRRYYSDVLLSDMILSHKLIVILLKLHCFRLLYFIRKRRLSV